MVWSAATPRVSNHVAVGCAAIMTRLNWKMRQLSRLMAVISLPPFLIRAIATFVSSTTVAM
jgi:hypothetical protein